MTVDGILSAEGWAVLLPADALSTPDLLPTGALPDFGPYFTKAFNAGGFAPGTAIVRLSVRGRSPDPIAVYDIRPVNMRRECLPTGAAVIFGNEGGDPADISFNLEAARPLARDTTSGDPSGGRPYFEGHSMLIRNNEPTQMILRLGATRHAYSFDLAFSYELDGKKRTQLVRRDGMPFRVAAELCPDPHTRQELSPEDVARLRSMRYGQVRVRKTNLADDSYYVVDMDPTKYMDQCPTLK